MYTIEKAKIAIKNGIKGYLLKDEKGMYVMKEVNRIPFYLEGEPGIGKTEIVRQIADELGIGYVSFSLTHHTRNSLLGLPVIKNLDDENKYTSYTISEIIAKVWQAREQHREGILLLDEFTCMSESIVPAMLAFLQTKNIGNHVLPEGWVLVLCGNPPKYNRNSKRFDAAVLDRVRRLNIQYNPMVFLEYAKQIDLHASIIEFIEMDNSNAYYYDDGGEELELVTCRSWENLSHMLKTYEALGQDVCMEDVGQFLKSETMASEFYLHYIQYVNGIKMDDIINILEGKDLEKYVAHIANKSFELKCHIVQSITLAIEKNNSVYFNWLKNASLQSDNKKVAKSNKIKVAEKNASDQVNNAFKFFALINDNRTILGMFYSLINENVRLLQLMNDSPCEEYLKECDNRYGSII